MATSIDFNTEVLGHSSNRVLGYSDNFFFYQQCTFRALSCINSAARKVPLERNRATDFCVPVQFDSFSFFYSSSVLRKKKKCSMIELSLLFLNTISSVNAWIVRIFKMVRFFDQLKLTTIYIYHVWSGHNVFFSQSHIRHLRFNNPFIKQIYSLKFFQRPGSILRQIGIYRT